MNYLKKLGKALGITFLIIIIGLLLITLYSYISEGIIFKVLKILIPIIATLIGGIIIGKNSTQKGLIEGLKFGIAFILIIILLNIILKNNIQLKQFIYYIVILFISSIGSILGINKKIDKQ